MKINTSSPSVAAKTVNLRTENPVAQAYGASSTSQSGKGSSHVALSSASRQLLALQEGGSDINVERVNAIRAAIASGELKIDTSRIADSLIASAQELLK
ncbi:flagellar biosynthesis anti-sigma factor FlgM [Bordetella genomosp. 13]|uniref:flagellar biosynthesis anti-sigma factor FlgM n=1 Tax=Bordetella genomosp. 13 TaxID=463040 RepID=UPI0011A77341|nr:flagellar biosynthesis anti-sigma factor FlgM [Bordetella genomosp. 13]